MRRVALLLLLVAGCDRPPPPPPTPGSRLEAAAVARGLVADAGRSSPVGSWANDGDRVCVASVGDTFRIGASVDYGEGQGCAASGTADRLENRLRVRFGTCRFDAAYDGDRITFPPELPAECERYCTGRASLTALSVERLSASASEAQAVRSADGRLLCGG